MSLSLRIGLYRICELCQGEKLQMREKFINRLWDIINLKFEGKWSLLAKKANISPGSFKRYLDGKTKPGFEQLIRICKISNVNPTWLLLGEGPMWLESPDQCERDKEDIGESIKTWIDNFLKNASEEEKHWFKIQFSKCFPDFLEWMEEKQKKEKKDV